MYTKAAQKRIQKQLEIDAILAGIKKYLRYSRFKTKEQIRSANLSCYGCNLCEMFYLRTAFCCECPVYKKTGQSACYDTPYYEIVRVRTNLSTVKPWQKACLKEVAFLRSLLPKNHPQR